MGSMDGRVAVVTGGGTGLGAAVARRLAGRGARVALTYSRSADEAGATAQECRALGVDAVALRGDVDDDAACRAVAAEVARRWGRIDVLVNNAGRTRIVPHSDLDGLTAEDFAAIYRTNVIGTYQMTRAVVPHMREVGYGAVVNVSSTSSLDGEGSSIAYAASKGALNTLTVSLSRALAPEIRVNAVVPGFIGTRWFSGPLGQQGYEDLVARVERTTPLRRAGTPEDIAAAVVFLCDEGAEHITGTTLVSDAGASLKPRA